MRNLLLSLNEVGPVFLVILVGVLLKRFRVISDEFSSIATAVVFRVGLPCLLFGTLVRSDFHGSVDPLPVVLAVGGTVLLLVLGWLTGSLAIPNRRTRGAFILGTYWCNCAIIGFAIIQNSLGTGGLVQAAFIVAFLVPLFNTLGITTLTLLDSRKGPFPVRKVFLMLATHPLIIATLLGLAVALTGIKIPSLLEKPVMLFGQMTLPLALLAIGASLSFSSIRLNFGNALLATFFKTVLMPGIVAVAAVLLGLRGDALVVLFILTGSPAAVTSFVISSAMKSDARLSANIVLVSTMASVLTLAAGLFLLRELRLM